jgi:peroxiredoxin (alkyl hydroperoxide reductase subunit C)
MSENVTGIQLGQNVPEFEINTFDPTTGDFGQITFADLKAKGMWTILFFYPADFTFV